MNLFYHPTLSELSKIIDNHCNWKSLSTLIVDHDGEVIIEPYIHANRADLARFRFYFKGYMWNKSYRSDEPIENLKFLNQLFKNLLYCWENNMRGCIDYNEITRVQQQKYLMEINILKGDSDLQIFDLSWHRKKLAQSVYGR